MITIDIDTGGTMTDALITDGAERHCIKVDTTPHDFTVSFRNCLEEASRLYGEPDLTRFLAKVALIRWSSTITTNVLAERRGVKVGLLVSKGHESDLYGDEPSIVLDELIPAENVLGLDPEPRAEDILLAVKSLLERGVRRICVSLAGAFPGNASEERVKSVIEGQYPDHLIGSVPVLLGSEMAPLVHDQTRAHYSLMNAYTHTALATSLFKAEDALRDEADWKGALLVGHTDGGVARIGKTKAVDTIESGPVFGTFGGAYVAQDYGVANAVCFDVGGTTTKASVVKGGQPVMQRGGELMEVPVETRFQMLRSLALGGGSVARVRDKVPVLGPDSMGAAPGPACYGLGGREATITDALLVLGYLEPERFLGGRRPLDGEKARAAIDAKVAEPLGISVDQAALLIRDEAANLMAGLVARLLQEADLAPEETSLFAYGGNGPLFACFVAENLDLKDVQIFDLGPVFSTFGSAQSNVLHLYERGLGCGWSEASASEALGRLWVQAVRDLEGEGFDPAKAQFTVALELDDGKGRERTVSLPAPAGPELDLAAIGAGLKDAGVGLEDRIVLLRLEAGFALQAAGLAPRAERDSAKPAERPIRFNGDGGVLPAYDWERLNAGDVIMGPAMVNGETMTAPVPPGWRLALDDYGNGRLERA